MRARAPAVHSFPVTQPAMSTIPNAPVPNPTNLRIVPLQDMTQVCSRRGVGAHPTLGVRGIDARGNTASIASTLQVLGHAESFIDYMQTVDWKNASPQLVALKMLFTQM